MCVTHMKHYFYAKMLTDIQRRRRMMRGVHSEAKMHLFILIMPMVAQGDDTSNLAVGISLHYNQGVLSRNLCSM